LKVIQRANIDKLKEYLEGNANTIIRDTNAIREMTNSNFKIKKITKLILIKIRRSLINIK